MGNLGHLLLPCKYVDNQWQGYLQTQTRWWQHVCKGLATSVRLHPIPQSLRINRTSSVIILCPSVRGCPNSAELLQTRSSESGSSFISQSSFCKGFVSLCCWLQVNLLYCFVYAVDTNFLTRTPCFTSPSHSPVPKGYHGTSLPPMQLTVPSVHPIP